MYFLCPHAITVQGYFIKMEITEEAIKLHKNSPVIDIHCHPSLKVILFDYKLYLPEHRYFVFPVGSPKNDEIFRMQYDLPLMREGGVKAICSSIYIVEKGLVENSSQLKFGEWITKGLGFNFDKAIEDTATGDKLYYQTLSLMEIMEAQVEMSSKNGFNVIFAKSVSQLESALSEGKTCLIHSLEGSHMLGRDLPGTGSYLDRIENLREWGVCSMTLAHFMPNDICYPVNGLSPQTRKALHFRYDYSAYELIGLNTIGKSVVEKMFDIGMIVDLTHLSPQGRKDVYGLNETRGKGHMRPLVFSHTGLKRNCPDELLSPEDWEVRKIRDSNGVIGVIFMNYWLRGFEGEPDNGIDNIVKTIIDIAKICSETESDYDINALNFNHASIGSDMDGFTQPVDDLYDSSQMMKLTQAMINRGISHENIQKVLGLNALRVFRLGWGK